MMELPNNWLLVLKESHFGLIKILEEYILPIPSPYSKDGMYKKFTYYNFFSFISTNSHDSHLIGE